MNNDFFNKFIEHGGGQGIEFFILVDQGNKLFCGLLLVLVSGDGLSQFFHFSGKFVLFIGVPSVKSGKARLRQFAENFILINLTKQFFQLFRAFFSFCQLFLFLRDATGLLENLCFLYRLDKFSLVILGIRRNGAERIGNQGQHYVGIDAVLGGTERTDGDLAVLGASILWDAFAVVGAVNVHFAAAVDTIHQTGKGMRLAPTVWVAPDIRPDALHRSMMASWV